jgi:hypothetical protein
MPHPSVVSCPIPVNSQCRARPKISYNGMLCRDFTNGVQVGGLLCLAYVN